MKKLILIFTFVSSIYANHARCQSWAPDGAEWYYDYVNFWYTGYVHVTVLGDTVINDTTCRILHRESVIYNQEFGTTNTYYYGRSYMFSDADRVYIFENEKFYTLYDFSASPGDTIIIPQNSSLPQSGCDTEGMIVVIDTGTMNINGLNLRKITVHWSDESHWAIYGNVVEYIGPIDSYMLPEPNWCVVDLFEGGPLRCYTDPEFGLYNTGMAPECDYLVSLPELTENNEILIFPNPSKGVFNVKVPEELNGCEVKIYDYTGQLIFNGLITSGEHNTDLTGFASGLYTIRIEAATRTISRTLVLDK